MTSFRIVPSFRTRTGYRAIALSSTILVTLLVSGARAQQWDGSDSDAWETGTNWVGDAAPTAGDDVVIDDNTPNPTLLTSTTTVNSTALGGTGALTIGDPSGSNASLTNTNGMTMTGGTLTVSNGLPTGSALDNGTAGLNMSGGTLNLGSVGASGPTMTGDVTMTGGTGVGVGNSTLDGSLTMSNGAGYQNGSSTITGNVGVSGAGTNFFNNSGIVQGTLTNNGGTIGSSGGTLADVNNISGAFNYGGGTAGNVTNTGDLNFTGGSMNSLDNNTGGDVDVTGGGTVDTVVTNAGALDINTGTLTVTGNSTTNENGGTLAVAAGATLASDVTNQTGAQATFNGDVGNVENTGGTVTISGGTTASLDNTAGNSAVNGGTIAGTTNVDAGEVTVAGGTLIGNSTVNGGTLDINSGTAGNVENAGGTLEIDGGAVASVDNTAGTATMGGGDITGNLNVDAGNVTTTGGTIGSVTQGGGALALGNTVQGDVTVTAGTLDLQTGAIVNGTLNNAGITTFDEGSLNNVNNSGTITVVGAQTIGGYFTNTGTVDGSTAGNDGITTTGTFATSGDITTDAGNTFTIAAGAIDLQTGATFNGINDLDGSVVLDGAVQNAADLDVTGNIALTGALTNQTTGVLDIAATLDMGSNAITNDGAALNVDAGGSITNGGALSNQNGGQLAIAAGGTATVASATNTGAGSVMTFGGTLTTAGGLTNQMGGQVIVNSGGDIDGTVTNTADLDLNGGTIGSLDNNAGGDVDVTGGAVVDAGAANAGTLDVASGTFDVTDDSLINEVGGTLTVANGATIDATITNQNGGTANIAGTVTGAVTNAAGGVLTANGAAANISDIVSNTGTFFVADGSTITVTNGVTNNAAGSLDLAGTLVSNMQNDGTLTLSDPAGQITGTLASTGSIAIDGGETLNVTGGTTVTAGTATINGILLGDLTVDSGGILTTSATTVLGSGVETITNNGSANFALNGFVNGTLVTTGASVTTLANGTILGAVNNTSGTLSLQDGALNTTVTVNNDAVFAGTLAFDVDLSDTSTSGDQINVGGNVSGTNVNLEFNNLAAGAAAGDIDGINLITYGGTSTLTFGSLSGLPLFGPFEYFVQDDGAGNITLESQVNSGVASLASTVGLTQTIVGAIINRPTSPFVADLATDPGASPCGPGAWVRITGGQADVDGAFSDIIRGSGGSTPVSLSYAGFQVGGDFACFDDRYRGFDMAFGAILGYNTGDSTNLVRTLNPVTGEATGPVGSITDTDFSQAYAGVYATASRGRFFADLQYRYEVIDFESNNIEILPGAGFDLNNANYESKGSTLSGAVGYSWPVDGVDGLNFVGSVGFSYSDYKTDDVDLGVDGMLELADGQTKLGFISGTLSRTRVQPDEVSLINYFSTATLYNDFAGDPIATFVDSGAGRNDIALSNLGSYGELSAGVNYVRLLNPGSDGTPRQLNASIRLDARKGQNVESWGLTGQLRIQF